MTRSEGTRRTALLDVNVLVALAWDQHVHHRTAHVDFGAVAPAWATTAVTEAGLLRVLLTPAAVGREVSAQEALGVLRGMRQHPGWRWLDDDASFVDATLDLRVLVGRRQVTDLHLVDLAVRHGCALTTFDAGIVEYLAPADRSHVQVWGT